jgi:hypothetical protein
MLTEQSFIQEKKAEAEVMCNTMLFFINTKYETMVKQATEWIHFQNIGNLRA